MLVHAWRVLLLLLLVPSAAMAQQPAPRPLHVYTDTLAPTWQNWSWNTRLELRARPAHTGQAAIAATFDQAWAGLYLHTTQPIVATSDTALRLWIHGGTSSRRQVAVMVRDSAHRDTPPLLVRPQAGRWTRVVVPLRRNTVVSGIIVQERSGAAQPAVYLDDIALIQPNAPLGPLPPPTALVEPSPIPSRVEPSPIPSRAQPTLPTLAGVRTAFSEPFDGDPAAPLRWQTTNWDVAIHTREATSTFDRMHAQHGADCGAPPATHTIDQYEQTVYLCRNHLMTAISASDYGMIYLTPDHMVDFSEGEAVVRFDMSTLRTSGRDWVDLWISPYADHLQLPLDDWLPDGQGEPRRGIHVRMDNTNDHTMFRVTVINGHKAVELPGNYGTGYETFLEPDAKRRDTFELRISETSVTFGMPDYNFWWVDATIAKLDWNQGVVQFGHHSYNPKKACRGCDANTWHWDNVVIEPATPFTIVRAAQRVVSDQDGTTVTFPTGAPANAHLRFAGIGGTLQVSYDGGSTWEDAQLQRQEKFDAYHFRSYWMPIPAGVQSVRFRGKNQGPAFYPGPWMLRDIAIWARP